MDYEKKYKEALNRAKNTIEVNQAIPDIVECVESLFPELAASEDERIRKWIIDDIRYNINNEPLNNSEYKKNAEKAIAWLEKQGEQKSVDKVEPIFNIGDTIAKKHNSDIHDFGSFTITDITGGKYWYNDRIICDITEQDEWEIYEPVRQKPTEWSNEDYNDIEIIACHLDNTDNEHMAEILRNIRDKYYHIILQNRWKPSEEQITWLYRAADNASKDSRMKQVLNNLLSDLKKLREE